MSAAEAFNWGLALGVCVGAGLTAAAVSIFIIRYEQREMDR